MRAVFAGPSVHGLSSVHLKGLSLLPPAACGDVAKAVRDGASMIGLIDGRFETAPATWHKELLWALSKGVRLCGSSSMGALRAAETYPYGMEGVGRIYRLYRRGSIRDDDEVALLHAPPEAGCAPLTEAMVNVRFTLRSARRRGVISEESEAGIAALAKRIFYKDRTYETILEAAGRRSDLCDAAAALRAWLPDNKRDVKREDAVALLAVLRRGAPRASRAADFIFPRTSFWDAFEARYLDAPA